VVCEHIEAGDEDPHNHAGNGTLVRDGLAEDAHHDRREER